MGEADPLSNFWLKISAGDLGFNIQFEHPAVDQSDQNDDS
jgi:hypothetical protein